MIIKKLIKFILKFIFKVLERIIPASWKQSQREEYRKGCAMFENTLVVDGNVIKLCCHPSDIKPKEFFILDYDNKSTESFFEAINKYKQNMDILHKKWLKMKKSPCDICAYLKQGIFPAAINIKGILFGSCFLDSNCNFRCCYCNASKILKNDGNTGNLYETILRLSDCFDIRGITFHLCTGEILIRKDLDLILNFLYEKGANISLTSNSSVYNERLLDFIKAGRCAGINTSLDAGTRETFAKIKGVDCFDKVVDNIFKYSEGGCRYFLKYIILDGINDNEADINGFVDVCKKANTASVYISANQLVRNTRLSLHAINMVILLYGKLKENLLKIEFSSGDFNPEDMKEIYQLIS